MWIWYTVGGIVGYFVWVISVLCIATILRPKDMTDTDTIGSNFRDGIIITAWIPIASIVTLPWFIFGSLTPTIINSSDGIAQKLNSIRNKKTEKDTLLRGSDKK